MARALGVSERTLLGHVPYERHDHFDADGNQTGYTVVTREPEWDAFELEKMLQLEAFDSEVCAGCGIHPTLDGAIEETVCENCRDLAEYDRRRAWMHERESKQIDAAYGGKAPPPDVPRPGDGLRMTLRLTAKSGDESEVRGGGS